MIKTRTLYMQELVPSYQEMIKSLDNDEVGSGKIRLKVINLCGYLNNALDYLSEEKPEYIENEWTSKNANEFRVKIENSKVNIDGTEYYGKFFGYIRDVANVSKHLKISRPEKHVSSIYDIKESIAIIRYEDSEGYYYGTKNIVVAKDVRGVLVPCELFIYLGFKLVSNFMLQSGILSKEPNIELMRNLYSSREEAKKIPHIQFFVGLDVNLIFSKYIFDKNEHYQVRVMQPGDEFNHEFEVKWCVEKNEVWE